MIRNAHSGRPMTYVPRSPRLATRLRAVVDDGARRAEGPVRNMSTSGMFVETGAQLAVGCRVAVVPLLGELDGQRLPAEIARVGERGLAVRFLGLDPEQRRRLRHTFSGDGLSPLLDRPRRPSTARGRPPAIPDDAPVFLLTEDGPDTPVRSSEMRAAVEELEGQLVELGRRNGALMDDNARLKRESASLLARLTVSQSLRGRLDEELDEARATIEELERAEDALVRRIQALEELVRGRRR